MLVMEQTVLCCQWNRLYYAVNGADCIVLLINRLFVLLMEHTVVMYAILGILGHIPHYPFRHCHQVGDRPIYH